MAVYKRFCKLLFEGSISNKNVVLIQRKSNQNLIFQEFFGKLRTKI